MTVSAFFASLGAALLARLSSVGAALAAAFGTLVMSFTADERTILLNAKQKFHDTYTAAIAANASEIDAIEQAATATLNQFCADEKAEMAKEVSATVTLLTSAAKSAAGIVKTAVTG